MRMWNVNPKLLCRKHLLGEHNELHMLAGALENGRNIKGYVDKGLVDTKLASRRHEELVREMVLKSYRHQSPMRSVKVAVGKVDTEANIRELSRRCPECRERIRRTEMVIRLFERSKI